MVFHVFFKAHRFLMIHNLYALVDYFEMKSLMLKNPLLIAKN